MITNVLITPRDAVAMGAFYASALEPLGKGHAMQFAKVAIKITTPEIPPARGSTKLNQGVGLRLLVLLGEPDWLSGARLSLEGLGIDVSRYKETDHARGMYVRDPDGNMVEMATVLSPKQGVERRLEAAAACRDPERSGERIARSLGATFLMQNPNKSIVQLGASRLHLYKTQSDSPPIDLNAPLDAFAGYSALGVRVPDPNATIARCKKAGMTVHRSTITDYQVIVRDDDGITLGIC